MSGNFKSLKAWQLAEDLVCAVSQATSAFPAEERYGLTQQMRRAAVSVVANIAEGATRTSEREYAQFLSIAKGSLAELECFFHVSKRLGFLDASTHQQLMTLHQDAARTLHGLLRTIKRSSTPLVPVTVG